MVNRWISFNPIHLQKKYYFPKTLKDRNFLEIQNFFRNEKDIIKLPQNKMRKINRILEKDANFLKKHNLMDYSLLIKIEPLRSTSLLNLNSRSRNIYISSDGTEAYHIGVIDYLQGYTLEKKLEYTYKSRLGSHPMSGLISSTSAPLYKERFTNFMRNKVLTRRTSTETLESGGEQVESSTDRWLFGYPDLGMRY